MENTPSHTSSAISKFNKFLERKFFSYFFLVLMLFYLLICGYVLIFSGSLFVEALVKGWYRPGSADYDLHSFFLGYLYGFPSLTGVVGGLAVLSTKPGWFLRIKILLFIPPVVWSTLLVIGNFRWGFTYWNQWLFLVPIMILTMGVLFCVVKKVRVPYHINISLPMDSNEE